MTFSNEILFLILDDKMILNWPWERWRNRWVILSSRCNARQEQQDIIRSGVDWWDESDNLIFQNGVNVMGKIVQFRCGVRSSGR